jgi:hypothetical protein
MFAFDKRFERTSESLKGTDLEAPAGRSGVTPGTSRRSRRNNNEYRNDDPERWMGGGSPGQRVYTSGQRAPARVGSGERGAGLVLRAGESDGLAIFSSSLDRSPTSHRPIMAAHAFTRRGSEPRRGSGRVSKGLGWSFGREIRTGGQFSLLHAISPPSHRRNFATHVVTRRGSEPRRESGRANGGWDWAGPLGRRIGGRTVCVVRPIGFAQSLSSSPVPRFAKIRHPAAVVGAARAGEWRVWRAAVSGRAKRNGRRWLPWLTWGYRLLKISSRRGGRARGRLVS